jgi:methylenetetrahydrofolate--tRNA-(uracil-5-)-methyltransferase
MNANFGLLPPLPKRIRNKQERNLALAKRALDTLADLCQREFSAQVG